MIDLPEGVRKMEDGRYAVDLYSRGITVAVLRRSMALTLRDADDIVMTARKQIAKEK